MKPPAKSYRAFPYAAFLVLLVLGFASQAFADSTPTFVYVANSDFDNISAYTVDRTTGALTPVPGSPFAAAGASPWSVAVAPSGKFAYVVTLCVSCASCLNGTVSAYTINSTTGALTIVPGSPLAAQTYPVSVAVDPSSKFVYVVNLCFGNVFPACVDAGGSISAYLIDSTTGALTPVSGSPFAAGMVPNPVSVAVHPSGKFAYVLNGCAVEDGFCSTGSVSAFAINSASGALTPVPGSPFLSGRGSVTVAVDPLGKFAYVTNDWGTVSAYAIDSTTGALAPVPGSPFAGGGEPISVAVDPSGKFAFVSNDPGTVLAYTINSTTGALTPAPGSPYAAGEAPNTVAVDPSGKFVYVANECASPYCLTGSVSAYAINSASGALTPVIGSPFIAGVRPRSLAIAGGKSTVPFDTFQAKVEIDEDRKTSFRIGGFFTLGKTSNGIDPVSESVKLQVGAFTATIPAGAFRKEGKHTFKYEGRINNVDLRMTIDQADRDDHKDRKDHGRGKDQDEGKDYLFTAEGKGDFPTKFVNPVTVGLTIGNYEGSVTVKADIDR